MSSNPVQVQNYEFALKLAKELAKDEEANLFISPASITVVLAMCYCGAQGETKKQMRDTIFGPQNVDDDIKSWVEAVLSLALTSNEDFTLKFANRLYANQNFQFKKEYVQLMVDQFKSGASSVNFSLEGDRIADEINKWVEKTTNNRIKDLVPKGSLDASTALLLINALYFKGIWDDQFTESSTQKQNFSSSSNKIIEVDMMRMTEIKAWFENEEAQLLDLEYGNSGAASMTLILPKQRNGLKNLIGGLNGHKLKQWIDSMQKTKVYMEIPKFKIEQSFKLNDTLTQLGVKNPFNAGTADFSGMIDPTNAKLHISDVFHKAFVEVDEKGTEAAAATLVKMVAYCAIISKPPDEPKRFIADHPFLFLLTSGDCHNKTILFMGQFYGKDKSQ